MLLINKRSVAPWIMASTSALFLIDLLCADLLHSCPGNQFCELLLKPRRTAVTISPTPDTRSIQFLK